MIDYSLDIKHCVCYNTMYNKSDVIYLVTYILTATNTSTNQSNFIELDLAIPYDQNNFKQFSSLTKDEVISWFYQFLSLEQQEKYKNLAKGKIEKTSYKKFD